MPIINAQIKGQGGVQPSGTITVQNNGTYDVTNYAVADVQVPSSAPAHYIEKTVDANGKLVNGTSIINFNGVTDVGDYMLYCAYYKNTSISGAVDMSALTALSGSYSCYQMFNDCTGITSLDLSSLTTISGNSGCNYMFYGCAGLTSVDLSSLTTMSGSSACSNMFYNCVNLTSVDLSGLTTINNSSACNSMFGYCTSLATVYIGNTTAIDFGTYTNQFKNMFSGCAQNIDVYAPAASQSTIESFSDYPNFGGTGTVTWHWRS